jgi:hypothetical protein
MQVLVTADMGALAIAISSLALWLSAQGETVRLIGLILLIIFSASFLGAVFLTFCLFFYFTHKPIQPSSDESLQEIRQAVGKSIPEKLNKIEGSISKINETLKKRR